MKETYSTDEFDALWADVGPRSGWDFSRMRDTSLPPWNYLEVVRDHLTPDAQVLDVGTGGGERLIELSPHVRRALGLDIDPSMIEAAGLNAADTPNVNFALGDATLVSVLDAFDVILNRQAPFDLVGVARHLLPGGWFITQQVGERNMRNVMEALGRPPGESTISRSEVIETQGLDLVSFDEYDVEYVVHDVESVVFWLRALDLLPPALETGNLSSVQVLNRILEGHVDERGFITNEHRYLVLARRTEDPRA